MLPDTCLLVGIKILSINFLKKSYLLYHTREQLSRRDYCFIVLLTSLRLQGHPYLYQSIRWRRREMKAGSFTRLGEEKKVMKARTRTPSCEWGNKLPETYKRHFFQWFKGLNNGFKANREPKAISVFWQWQEMDSNGIKLFSPKAVQSVSKRLCVLLSTDYLQ